MPKLTLSLLLVILIAVLGIGGALDNFFSQYQIQSSKEFDELSAYHTLGKSLAATLDKQHSPQQFITNWQQESKLSVSLVHLSDFSLPEALKQEFYSGEAIEYESDNHISIHFLLPLQKKVLILTIPSIVSESQNSTLQLLLTVAFYLGILMVVLIWLYPLIKQLKQLRQSTKAFGEGKLQQRISVSSNSYIASIENEFNRMAEQIETLISDNKLLSDAIAHDLRTPLARLRFGIETLQETQHRATRDKYQQRLSRDINEMERLVNVLLNYARIEQSMIAIEQQSINLNDLISQCVGAVIDDNKTIDWHAQGDAMVNGDANYLSMLVNNLLGNALQYADSKIVLRVIKSSSMVQFIISDDGPGITKEKRSELLKPFIRGEHSHEIAGYGMGLAIVSRIAKLHNATLIITDSAELGGAEFRLTFNGKSLIN